MLAMQNDHSDSVYASRIFFEYGHEALGLKYLDFDSSEVDDIHSIYCAAIGGHLDIRNICDKR